MGTNHQPMLILYGKPAAGYAIDSRTNMVFGSWKTALTNLTLTNLFQGFAPPASGGSMDHAKQRPDRELAAKLEPCVELIPCPAVHPDLASLAALPASDEHGAAVAVQLALQRDEPKGELR